MPGRNGSKGEAGDPGEPGERVGTNTCIVPYPSVLCTSQLQGNRGPRGMQGDPGFNGINGIDVRHSLC